MPHNRAFGRPLACCVRCWCCRCCWVKSCLCLRETSVNCVFTALASLECGMDVDKLRTACSHTVVPCFVLFFCVTSSNFLKCLGCRQFFENSLLYLCTFPIHPSLL